MRKPKSKEHTMKMIASLKGRIVSDETKEKMRKAWVLRKQKYFNINEKTT